ncbi:MAG: DNA polymerase III subunit alpha, partial [Turicibacter sp.]|nr:DNA polymerase III subunit alpha [Turicibacter sp.]
MSFINLNVRSSYSLLGSTIEIDSLIAYAQERKLTTLSLVEDGSMHSAVKFFIACQKAGIKPVFGVSLTVVDKEASSKWTLFARNQTGYRVLLKLTSDEALTGKVQVEDVLAHAQHLVACVDVEAVTTGFDFITVPDQFYLGISSVLGLQKAKSLQNLHVPFVYLNEVRVLSEEDVPVLQVLQAIKENVKISQVDLGGDLHVLSARAARLLGEQDAFLATAMANTTQIAELCQVTLDLGRNLLPKFEVPSGDSALDYLQALCERGAKRRYGNKLTPQHQERLTYELTIIGKMGFADYFLIVWDFIKYAKSNGILVGPGRGSAAGSLVSYVLGITGVDPIAYDLLFERFLNPERISLPDIDIDFQDDRRDEVIAYVNEKYGEFAVCQIATFGTFATRSSWRDTARVHGLETAQINAVTKHLRSGMSLAGNLKENAALQSYLESHPSQRAVYMKAMRIEGFPRHVSTHAAGVIISPADLRNFTALGKGPTDVYLSQYEAGDLEALGLLKMDFLGLRNLTMIQEISAQVRAEVDGDFDINRIPLDDKLTYELIASANTTGIFQLESGGMRAALRQTLPSNIEDIISVLALFRPGPMANIPMFAARKHGRDRIIYDHPTLEPILRNTYGVIVYQEQIMQIVSVVAGYSLGEADILRRAISKKDSQVMQAESEKFTQRAQTRGYDARVAKKIFDLILRFANYGFNRSHAASYAMISYQMAYLKANVPQYFMVSVLITQTGSAKGTAAAIKEARSLGIDVLPPSVNESDKRYRAYEGNIRLGFLSIKHIGVEMANKLVLERKNGAFTTFFDFVKRTHEFLGEKVLAALIDVGACDEFGYSRSSLHINVGRVMDFVKYDGGLFGTTFEMETVSDATPDHLALMEREVELFGFYLQTHPIQLFDEQIRGNGWLVPSDI